MSYVKPENVNFLNLNFDKTFKRLMELSFNKIDAKKKWNDYESAVTKKMEEIEFRRGLSALNDSVFYNDESVRLLRFDYEYLDEIIDGEIIENLNSESVYNEFLNEIAHIKTQHLIEVKKRDLQPALEITSNTTEVSGEKKTELTNRQKTLIFYYLFREVGVKNCDKTEIARFIQSVTGIEPNTKITDTTLYKSHLREAGSKAKTENQFKDLHIVKGFFENLKLSKIVANINNDMKDFNSK